MAAADDQPPQLQPRGARRKDCVAITLIFIAAMVLSGALVIGIVSWSSYNDRKFPPTVFTVAITGVTGLDPVLRQVVDTQTSPAAADDDYRSSSSPPPTTLISPVFNLTFQIDNTGNPNYDACVPGISRVDVSYGGVFLAGGSVPPFCAGETRTSGPVAATAWGENVTVPRFVRDRLAAGDTSVDVKVTMTAYCRYGRCGGNVLSCKAKIEGGMSPACRLDRPRPFCEEFGFCR